MSFYHCSLLCCAIFLLVDFKMFSLRCFLWLTLMCLGVIFFVFILCRVYESLNLEFTPPPNLENFQLLFIQIFFVPLAPPSLFESPSTCMLEFLTFFPRSLRLCSFFKKYFLSLFFRLDHFYYYISKYSGFFFCHFQSFVKSIYWFLKKFRYYAFCSRI